MTDNQNKNDWKYTQIYRAIKCSGFPLSDSKEPSCITWPLSIIYARKECSSGANWESPAFPPVMHHITRLQHTSSQAEHLAPASSSCDVTLKGHNRDRIWMTVLYIIHWSASFLGKGHVSSKMWEENYPIIWPYAKKAIIKQNTKLHNVNIRVHVESHETTTHQSGQRCRGEKGWTCTVCTRTHWPSRTTDPDGSGNDAARFKISVHISSLPKMLPLFKDLEAPRWNSW